MTSVMSVSRSSGERGIDSLIGAGALLATITAVKAVGLERTVAAIDRWVRRRRTVPGTLTEARAVYAAIDGGVQWLPCRVACLERSLTACVVLAARGRRVQWRLGVRFDPPLTVHAWIVADGEPVGETDDVAAAYHPLLSI